MTDVPTIREGSATDRGDEERFEADARAAGIVLPRKSHSDLTSALVVAVAVIVLAAGVGEVTGWINLRAPSSQTGNYQVQTCAGYPVETSGAVSGAIDPGLVAWLEGAGANMSTAVGGCFTVTVADESGDGYVSLYGSPPAEFVSTYAPPSASDALANPVTVVPITLGAVALVYDLPGVGTGLNLTASALAGIFTGAITSWDDPAIADANPGLSLSGLPPIAPIHFSESSVATQTLTQYLSGENRSWNSSVGAGLTVGWPGGTSVDSAADMLSQVVATPGSIGYVEIFGAPPASVGVAQVQDLAGDFAGPNAVDAWISATSVENTSAVVNGSWSGFSLTGAAAPSSYPLTVLTFAGIYRDLGVAYSGTVTLTQANWLLTYLYWLSAQSAVAPLPTPYVTDTINVLNNETYDGTTIVHLESESDGDNDTGGETGEF